MTLPPLYVRLAIEIIFSIAKTELARHIALSGLIEEYIEISKEAE